MNNIPSRCPGTQSRRTFLRTSLAGLGSFGLADLLQAEERTTASPKSIIVLWLWGGASHMETFDMKPDAPAEYRGDFRPIRTNVPGIDICEHLPRLARLADKYALIRSLRHDSQGHVSATHTFLSGYPGEVAETNHKPNYPYIWSAASRVLGERATGMPPYVGMPAIRYHGAAYLGRRYDPLMVSGDPTESNFQPPSLSLALDDRSRFMERMRLLDRFDNQRRDLDASGSMDALGIFQQKAVNILRSDAARNAFDLAREPERIRDRYGRHAVGQRCLLARRLIEAGTRIVSIDFPCVPGQKAFSWDDHAGAWHIFDQMKIRLPVLDQVVSALIEDLHTRGLARDTLLLVTGEMSHTPRLSDHQGQPGREHWTQAMSLLLAGGGMPMGQVIGATGSKGEEPKQRPLRPNDFLATLYSFLGVPLDTMFADHSGRPIPLLPDGLPISELV
ncbi:MAG: DUF1501 domain-containing protein [Planctomycetes bacterium]|nr:DUF1501 domain-containing protein [Planctomycetota bacterium]